MIGFWIALGATGVMLCAACAGGLILAAPENKRHWRRLLVVCGCLVLAAVAGIAHELGVPDAT